MKKTLLILANLTLGILLPAQAQTQQGYVKTLGRPGNKGKALSGVTIRVKGQHNPVLSNADGTFSLTMDNMKNGDPYSLQQVQKKGYEVNEASLIGRQQPFSNKVPLQIVMVSSGQLNADKARIEEKAQQVASKNYAEKIAQLKQELANNKISAEQYQTAANDLLEKFENYQLLIEGLAEHYAHTDYDLLNETEREINLCIENGDLNRADSLLKSVFDPIDVIKRNKEALAEIDLQIAQSQGIIDKAQEDMAAVLKRQEKDAEYLYQLYSIALARFDNDKALSYIETRAALDTTKWEWQFDAGGFCFQQNMYDEAIVYYERVINKLYDLMSESLKSSEKNDANDIAQNVALQTMFFVTENNLAVIYSKTHRYAESEELFLDAIDYYKGLFKVVPNDELKEGVLGQFMATSMMGLSEVYRQTQRYNESEAMSKEAMSILKSVHSDDPVAIEIDRAKALMSQGLMHKNKGEYKKSEDCYREALEMHRRLTLVSPENEAEVARTLHNYANMLSDTKRYNKSEPMYKEASEIYRRLVKNNPKKHEPMQANILSRLGNIYLYHQNRYDDAVPPLLDAFRIYQRLASSAPKEYEKDLFVSKFNLTSAYYKSDRIDESLPLWVEVLEEFPKWVKDDPETFRENYARTIDFVKQMAPWLHESAKSFRDDKLYEKSELYFNTAAAIYHHLNLRHSLNTKPKGNTETKGGR